MKNNEIIDRLMEVLNQIGVPLRGSKTRIADDTGYHFSMVGRYLEQKKPISDRFLKIFCSTYGVNEKWLKDGEGQMMIDPEAADRFRLCERINIREEVTADTLEDLKESVSHLNRVVQKKVNNGVDLDTPEIRVQTQGLKNTMDEVARILPPPHNNQLPPRKWKFTDEEQYALKAAPEIFSAIMHARPKETWPVFLDIVNFLQFLTPWELIDIKFQLQKIKDGVEDTDISKLAKSMKTRNGYPLQPVLKLERVDETGNDDDHEGP